MDEEEPYAGAGDDGEATTTDALLLILTINIGILLDEVRGALGKYCVSAQRNVRRNVTIRITNEIRHESFALATRSRSDTFAQGLKTETMEKRKSQRSHRARQRVLSSSSSSSTLVGSLKHEA